jgi:shikimate dehydrogenase
VALVTGLVVLLGHGIGYSASPSMHNAAFAALDLSMRYELRDVAPEALPTEVAALRGPGMRGANVTQPHKGAIVEFVDELAPDAVRVRGVNTIVTCDGRLIGHNTDLPAVDAELRELGTFRSAVILGRGAAARTVEAALVESGAVVQLVARDRWGELPALLPSADLLVNATPIGTASDESPLPASLLRPELAVLDLVYRPSPSRLVRDARAIGAAARGGAGMLLRQAAASFSLWTGCPAPTDVMRSALGAELGPGTDA